MSDQIKEKLDNLRIYAGREENGFISDIEDYITNLQQEKEDYKSRCEKAIEYINKHTDKLKTIRVPKIDFNYNNLLNILQGAKDE